ncbi:MULTISPECIES: hypothetical protein [Streptomyces]|uniref:Uncharacterized protein n=1 Tax=Streptomyces olivaceoviridis TaxID=1921 RepID=A0ABW7VRQ5_STROI|nr:hypothetical protein [Streptomyces corchorusii]
MGRKEGDGFPAGVRFKQTERTDQATYHVYGGPSRRAALEFLRGAHVKDELVYNIVETPEGNFGRDLVYLFHEADGELIELGERPQSRSPSPSGTRCAWCGFFVVPYKLPINEENENVGSVSLILTYTELAVLVKTGGGLHCGACSMLQCAVCSGITQTGGTALATVCRACGGKLAVQTVIGPVERAGASGRPDAEQMVTLPPDPDGDELWGMAPLRLPWSIDVARFFGQSTLPYVWPGDARHTGYIGSGEQAQALLRASWTKVFLHHPNPEVVLGCLRSAPPDGMLTLSSLADLLASPTAEPRVKEEASRVLWQLSDGSVGYTLNILLSRGILTSGYDTHSVHQALGHLRTACPQSRRAWFEEQLARSEDD